MGVAPSIVPCGGPGAMLQAGNNLPLPRGVIRPATRQLEGSLRGAPLVPCRLTGCQGKHDGDHEYGPTSSKITPPKRAATPHYQSAAPCGSAYGVPENFG